MNAQAHCTGFVLALLLCWPDRSTPRQTWSLKAQSCMLGTGVTHFGGPPTHPYPLICFAPGWESSFRLIPMHNSRLIAPIQKPWHRRLVSSRHHEKPHTLLFVPGGHGPEGPASICQKTTAPKSRRLSNLPQGAKSVQHEGRQEANRPNPQARDTDKGHAFTP
jgi:hypothetical protein